MRFILSACKINSRNSPAWSLAVKACCDAAGSEDRNAVYDLSAVLAKPPTIYEKRLNAEWLLFAPDRKGWPILVSDAVHDLLDCFRTPTSVGGAFASRPSASLAQSPPTFGACLETVAVLEKGGFLRPDATQFPYAPPVGETSPPKAIEVWLHLTNGCNLTCSYCFVRDKDNEIMRDSVCDATVEKLARSVVANGIEKVTIKFAGGEPTLAMPLVERFRDRFESAVADTGIHTHAALLSNGTLITDRVIAFLDRPNSSISISLDGCGGYHDIHRRTKKGAPTWKRIEANFDRLQRHGVSPFVMSTISDESRHGLPDLLDWVFARGLRTRIGVVREPCDKTDAGYADYCRGMSESFDAAFAELEAKKTPFDPRQDLHICELRFDQPAYRVACGIGASHVVVKPNGELVSCPMTVDGPGRAPGTDLLETCRENFPFDPADPRATEERTNCLSCQWFPVCAGGCPVNNERTRGYAVARSPLCNFYQSVIPRYLDLFGRKLQAQRAEVSQQLM
jgi:uncharacterized protein